MRKLKNLKPVSVQVWQTEHDLNYTG